MQPRIDPSSLIALLNAPLPPKLVPVCGEIRKLLGGGTVAQAKGRYWAGELVQKVRENRRQGDGGVVALASELRLEAATLYEFSRVAALWPRQEFLHWMEQHNAVGLPLTWSHFRVLLDVKSAARRKSMLAIALENSLSSRDLAREIQHELRIVESAERDPLVASAQRLTARMTSLAESTKHWKKTVVPRLLRANQHKVGGLLRDALAAAETLRNELDEVVDAISSSTPKK